MLLHMLTVLLTLLLLLRVAEHVRGWEEQEVNRAMFGADHVLVAYR